MILHNDGCPLLSSPRVQAWRLFCVLLLTVTPCAAAMSTTFHVAPMQGYTNRALRALYVALNPTVTTWTEMEKLSDLQNAGWRRRFDNAEQAKCVLQIGTADVTQILTVLPPLLQAHVSCFDEVNLNCGCPSIQAGGAATYGASLMQRPAQTAALVQALRRVVSENTNLDDDDKVKVSLKCRLGIWQTPDRVVLPAKMYDLQHDYVTQAHAAGLQHVVVHARPAILQGFSPVQNRCIPALDYSAVQRLAADFSSTNLRVTLNGGIDSLVALRTLQQQHDENAIISSFMAGRWMLQRPLDVAYIHNNNDDDDSVQVSTNHNRDIPRAVERYIHEQVLSHKDDLDETLLHEACLPLYLVTQQLAHDYGRLLSLEDDSHNKMEEEDPVYLTEKEMEELYGILVQGVQELYSMSNKKLNKHLPANIHFKKLSTSFKGLVGTKVVNKWKRNRAEL